MSFSVLNMIVGLNGVKSWARNQRRERQARLEEQSLFVDEKEQLIQG